MKEKLKDIIKRLKKAGVDYADCRYVRRDTESIMVSDGKVEGLSRDIDVGVGVRVLHGGAWGFASTAVLTDAALKDTANKAVQIAKASAITQRKKVILAEQEAFKDHYVSPCNKDPFKVAIDTKLDLLINVCDDLRKSNKIKKADAGMRFFRNAKIFVSTEGAEIEQDIVESGGGFDAGLCRYKSNSTEV